MYTYYSLNQVKNWKFVKKILESFLTFNTNSAWMQAKQHKTYSPCSTLVHSLLKLHTIGISASITETFQSKTSPVLHHQWQRIWSIWNVLSKKTRIWLRGLLQKPLVLAITPSITTWDKWVWFQSSVFGYPMTWFAEKKAVRGASATHIYEAQCNFNWFDHLITGDEKWVMYVNHTRKRPGRPDTRTTTEAGITLQKSHAFSLGVTSRQFHSNCFCIYCSTWKTQSETKRAGTRDEKSFLPLW